MVAALACVGVGLSFNADAKEQSNKCVAPIEMIHFKAVIPQLSKAIKNKEPIRIVALGSSSTSGTGASSKDKRYPSRLQAELRQRFKDSQIEVINSGVFGQLASDMLKRLHSDVFAHKPQLVIWQTGVNEAHKRINPETFTANLLSGLQAMRSQGIDVVFLDPQYTPKADQAKRYDKYMDIMRDISLKYNVPMLSRYNIMKYLVTSAQYSIDELLSPDQLHLNDESYRCIGLMMAEAIEYGVKRELVVLPQPVKSGQTTHNNQPADPKLAY